jgi:hypothetical protein
MNSAYKEYARLAYRRSVVAALRRHLEEFLPSEVPAMRTLQCEEVLVNDRDVPDEAFLDYLDDLRVEEADIKAQMSQFEFRRRDARGKPQQEEQKSGDELGEEEDGESSSLA